MPVEPSEEVWAHNESRTALNGLGINLFVYADEDRTRARFQTQCGEGEELPPPETMLRRAIETLEAELAALRGCPVHVEQSRQSAQPMEGSER